jgi:tripartite-type tricarboxylate transporter receptor subunit TctC
MLKTFLVPLASLLFAAAACAQDFPARPITLVLPAPPGGGVDTLARVLADELGRRLNQAVIVDNRPGAAGMLAAQAVARAVPDGHTLLVTHSSPILNVPHLFKKVPYDVKRDFAFVSQLCAGPVVLAVHKNVPARDMKAFIAWARQGKGTLSYGSYGVGSASHLASAHLSQSRGLGMTHVPYRGEAPMVQDLIGGQIPMGVASLGTLAPHLQSGRVRALAVIGNHRPRDLPGVPTMAEAGLPDPELRPAGWVGVLAPAGTPPAALARLEKELRAAALSTPMKARFQVFGMDPVASSAADFRKDYDTTAPVVERLIKASGIQPE